LGETIRSGLAVPADEADARRFALRVAGLAAAVPLLEQGTWGLSSGKSERSAWAARRWILERLPQATDPMGAPTRRAAAAALSGFDELA
jgi:hypothetical protein